MSKYDDVNATRGICADLGDGYHLVVITRAEEQAFMPSLIAGSSMLPCTLRSAYIL